MTKGSKIADQLWLTSWEKHNLAKAIDAAIAEERERCAKMVEDLRAAWFHEGVPGDTAVPAGAFARSMKQLAAVIRDPSVSSVSTE